MIFAKRLCLPFLGVLVVAGMLVRQEVEQGLAAEPAPDIQKLIEDLDSNEFQVRERASNKLLALEEKALPALREAARGNPSLEKLRRLEAIIARTEQIVRDREIAKLVAQVNEMGIDQFVDYMVEQKGFASDKTWEAAWRLAQAMAKRADQAGGKNLPAVAEAFLKYPLAAQAPERNYNSKTRFLVSGLEHVNVLHDCFLISSGPVKHLNSTANSIIFVNGDIAHWNGTRNSIIFCDGNVQHLNGTDHCVIFCTGDVEGLNSLRHSVVFANGEFKNGNSTVQNIMRVGAVKTNHSQGNQYVGLKEIKATLSQNDTFPAAEREPLYPLVPFNLARLGIEVAVQNDSVVVTKTVAEKLLTKAGVRQGDQITAIDGTTIKTSAEARRLLRRKLPGDTAVLQLTRGPDKLNLTITLGR